MKNHPCKFLHSTGKCKNGANCQFSHDRLQHDQIDIYVEENEDFLDQVYKETGTTNLGQYFINYKRDKEIRAREQLREAYSAKLSNSLLPDEIKASLVSKDVDPRYGGNNYQNDRQMISQQQQIRDPSQIDDSQNMNKSRSGNYQR